MNIVSGYRLVQPLKSYPHCWHKSFIEDRQGLAQTLESDRLHRLYVRCSMQPLEDDQLQLLTPRELASRIDAFFYEDRVSRYCKHFPSFVEISAIDMLNSQTLSALQESDQKNSLYLFYRARFQSALCMQYAGIGNRLVHSNDLTDDKWSQPKSQILNAAVRQAMIVSGRIAFECLMEFIYFVENLRLIPGSRSKLGKLESGAPSQAIVLAGWSFIY